MHYFRSVLSLAFVSTLCVTQDQAYAQQLKLTPVVSWGVLTSPSAVATPAGDTRLFVAERVSGKVQVFVQGVIHPTPYLDLGGMITSTGERGLLGMAFHPQYSANGFFFVSYTDINGSSVVARYTVDPLDPNRVDPATAYIAFGPLVQSSIIHKGGCVRFGPDGMLYLSLGDDGMHTNGQNLAVPKGKLLRIDVDAPAPHVPLDNPFVGQPGHNEYIWASGLRNPWRFSFDRLTGDLWIGDVGADTRDEVDVLSFSASRGANFGWSCFEGTFCFNPFGCNCATPNPSFVPPIYESAVGSGGCALVGGVVYRGQAWPSLVGRYMFTNWCGGGLRSFRYVAGQAVGHITYSVSPPNMLATSLDEGPGGEMYLSDMNGGRIFRIDEDCGTVSFCPAPANSSGQSAMLGYSGTLGVVDNSFFLEGSNLPVGQTGYFLGARNDGFATNPGGSQGYLCLGSQNLARFRSQLGQVDIAGEFSARIDLSSIPSNPPVAVTAGDTWTFQFWHRDANPGPTSNFTAALMVTFCP